MENTTPAPASPALSLLEIALSGGCAASVRAAVELGLPDALGDTAATADDLAQAVAADPDALRRLLRALMCYGVFAEDADGRFVHTATSRMLTATAPDSLRDLFLWCTDTWTWPLWGKLAESVRSGKGSFAGLFGREYFEQLHTEWPESAALFNLAMTQSSRQSAPIIADMLPVAGAQSVVDVAGGQGYLLATILERHPGLRGTLLDLPDVVAHADARLLSGGTLADRVELLGGDCRAEVPVRADIYLFKNILGLGDTEAVQVMRNVVQVARPGAHVVIVENLVDSGPGQKFSTSVDLRMLLTVGGRKHTRQGLLDLVAEAGLVVQEVRTVDSYQSMVVATVPAQAR